MTYQACVTSAYRRVNRRTPVRSLVYGLVLIALLSSSAYVEADVTDFEAYATFSADGRVSDPNGNGTDIHDRQSVVSQRDQRSAAVVLNSKTYTTNGASVTYTAFAFARPGNVGAGGSVTSSADHYNADAGLGVSASAGYSDTITLGGNNPKYFGKRFQLQFSFDIDGSFDHSLNVKREQRTNPDYTSGSTEGKLFLACSVCDIGAGMIGRSFHQIDDAFPFNPVVDEEQAVPDQLSYLVTLVGGVAFPFAMSLEATAAAGTENLDQGELFNSTASGASHFERTVALEPLIVRDATTGEVINDISITSASGYDYLHGTMVPEVETYASVLVGLVVLGIAARRRAKPQL